MKYDNLDDFQEYFSGPNKVGTFRVDRIQQV